MLKVMDLEKKYKDHIIFKDVNLEFEEGRLYILQGVNGSGKSTLLKIIAGVIYKSSGHIIKVGEVSYLPDRYTMPKLMLARRYISELLVNDSNRKKTAKKLLDEYQIPDKRIGDLSKGNQQKVGIIQVFSIDAKIYLLDEPMDGLDEDAKHLVKDRIKEELAKKKIVILSLHNKTFFNDLSPIILEVKEETIREKKRRKEA